jgi:dual specificity tyrosine-phosphorylation-regulated kinase 2/3/4
MASPFFARGVLCFADSPRQETYDQNARPRAKSVKEPTLHASPANNHSLFSFGGGYSAADETSSSTLSYDFLPSPSFDDLQSSIATASNDFNFDSQTAERNAVGGKRPAEGVHAGMADIRASVAGRGPSGPRPARTNSMLRRQSLSTRQSSVSSTTSGTAGAMDPPSAPFTVRTRRQSQYPPVSSSATANAAKAPRRSIGAGVIDSDYTRPGQRRRPSLATSASLQGLSDAGAASARVNAGAAPTYTDGARGLTASRAAKTKSLQPPSRQGQTNLNTNTPDHSRSSSFAGRSPGKSNGRGTTTPSSAAKRMSVMPGMPTGSHATGLGARTVSPTDARRAKRLSILQNPPPMPSTPPTPQPDMSKRTSSRSPSMLPRKVSTPSSSRTTPDLNRKSYSSGLSVTSSASYNTSRTSIGSLQNRNSQLVSSSRLPTPKPRNVHSSAGNDEDDEEVPPVPAIPKAYESPKESPAEQPFFTKRKSSMPFDASSINSTSTTSLSGRGSIREPPKSEREPKTRLYNPESDQNNATPAKKKNLQPLRLPPMNLLPLSTPTTNKIAALHDKDSMSSNGQITPPPRRATNKTPSTPMTASKASFFSRKKSQDKIDNNLSHMRSSSSIHLLRSESSSQMGGSSSESSKPIAMNNRQPRQNVSPFVSSSLPKNTDEHQFMPRSKTSGDISTMETGPEPVRPARLTGPRAPKTSKSTKTETPVQISDVEEPSTPSSGTSLRRKLSLGWKRSTSKINNHVSHAASERGSEYPPQPPKHDNMPPPRLPASATMNSATNNSVPSPSPSVKSATFLDSKRRKSSISSLSMFGGHDRTRSDSWGVSGSPKKESEVKSERTPLPTPTTRASASSLHKMLSSKASTNTMRDHWTVDLDRDDLIAEDEMKKLASKRKETEQAARQLDALRKRATAKERVSSQQAIQIASLNIFERGEIVDYKDVYFCGTASAAKHVGELSANTANFGYDDERGDYSIVQGDHLCYRYEIIDVLGKGSFGQVVRCIDHKTGGLVAVKIIRNKKRFHQQALVEVNILQKLREWVSKSWILTC